MDKETEEWFKEIKEKSKQALMEHFEQEKYQRWCEQQIRDLPKPKAELHYSSIDWEIDEDEFDDFTENNDNNKGSE